MYWRQRSRKDWLAFGDKNSKFFHHKASKKKQRLEINCLENQNGEWTDDINEIGDIATNYFIILYESSGPPQIAIDCVYASIRPFVS